MTTHPATAPVTESTSWMTVHEHYLRLRLERLRMVIDNEIAWLRDHGWTADPMRDFQHLVVSDAQADRMLLPSDGRSARMSADAAKRLADMDGRLHVAEHRLADHGGPSTLALLADVADLSSFEQDVLFMALAPELEAGFARLYAYVQDDAALSYATPGLAAMLSGAWSPAAWESFLPDAPLSRLRLLTRPEQPVPLAARPLQLDGRLSAFLRGVNQPDERLRPVISPLHALSTGPAQREIVERLTSWLTDATRSGIEGGINLVGRSGAGRRTVAANLCAELGMALIEVDVARLVASPHRDELTQLLSREALLLPTAIYLDADQAAAAEPGQTEDWVRLANDLVGFVVVGSRDRRTLRRQLLTVTLPPPDRDGSVEVWHTALNADIDVGPVVQQFRFGPHGVQQAAAEARAFAELRGGGEAIPTAAEVWRACRVHAGHELGELAQRLDGAAEWDQLILPDDAKGLLREIAAQVAHRARVYGEWGWDRRLGRGQGISALFAGPPGTGKTMAAEILGAELDLELYRIDLSQVVSKYIGETEKNLRRLFDAAEQGGAILFFDEADALFGKRTEVKDSHDRYANIEINYLLQRMEDYRGLAILATNRKSDLDDAFLRRIRFVVTFPFPDPASRLKIWQVIFPPEVPTSGLDVEALARLDIAGGNIRNVAVNASFLAAADGDAVTMAHVMQAARREYHKIEKLVSRSEFGDHLAGDA